MKISTIIRTILYSLFLPFLGFIMQKFELILDADSPLANIYDVILNPSVAVLNDDSIFGVVGFLIFFFLPIDLVLLRVKEKVDKKFFTIVFSIPLLINTGVIIKVGISIIRNIRGRIVYAIILCFIVHLIRVINMYLAIFMFNDCNDEGVFNRDNSNWYLPVYWITMGIWDGAKMAWYVALIISCVGLAIAILRVPKVKWRKCPKCGTWVGVERSQIEKGRRTETRSWTSNDKVAELRDDEGNHLDVYKDVTHYKDELIIDYDYWYNYNCPNCGYGHKEYAGRNYGYY